MAANDLWYKNAVFYEIYVRAFYDSNGDGRGDLPGLTARLDYLQELGVDCLWLLPIYPSPLRDGGYDIADFCGVHPDYGSVEDFRAFLKEAHARGLRVILDLVLNHTSDQHAWFQAARRDRNSPYRRYYVWSDTDRGYPLARVIFLDFERSNWAWDSLAGQYYWHRFFSFQPDLNYENPAVRAEILKVAQFWLDLGVDGFRADAVPYLFEREGTNCENLPETHAFLKELRRFVESRYPDRILLCEANQWPQDVRPYFGDGDECHMGFHFPLMPRLFVALKKEDVAPLVWILEQTPPIPENCQWCTFLRNHDELTLEMVTEEERQWLWREYAPLPRMRLNLGIRRRLAPLLENDRRKIELAHSLLFTLAGSPILYYGDEIGMGDDIWLPDREGVRTPMQWGSGANAGFSRAPAEALYAPLVSEPAYVPQRVNVASQRKDPGSLLNAIRRMIAVRKSHPALGWGEFSWVRCDSAAVAAYLRRHGADSLLVVNNLSSSPRSVILSLEAYEGASPRDLFEDRPLPAVRAGKLALDLQPCQYLWLRL